MKRRIQRTSVIVPTCIVHAVNNAHKIIVVTFESHVYTGMIYTCTTVEVGMYYSTYSVQCIQ